MRESVFDSLHETREAEVARLAAAPSGSTAHTLSQLPVNIDVITVHGQVIQLPRETNDGHTIIVVPYQCSPAKGDEGLPRKRNADWWYCVIVASDSPHYPAGRNIYAPESELVRGVLRPIALEAVATAG